MKSATTQNSAGAAKTPAFTPEFYRNLATQNAERAAKPDTQKKTPESNLAKVITLIVKGGSKNGSNV